MARRAEGKVFLIGAGPGDPKLLTLRGAEVLRQADAILIDHLVNRELLSLARRDAEVIDVGKLAGGRGPQQRVINELLVARARAGQLVARLKGGDPFVFGRGGEEAEALADAEVEWEVVPGVSSGIAAAAYAGIPLLHRRLASSVAFASGHEPSRLGQVAAETLVIFMCGATIGAIAGELIARGREPSTPVALVRWGTRLEQQVFRGTLAEVAELGATRVESPVLAVIGKVVSLADRLRWFGGAPQPISACRRIGRTNVGRGPARVAGTGLGAAPVAG